ncbi:MAG TPA: acylneuraminate cytidylyltransferase family protein [Solirubrobacteraceae bacterium]
MCAGCTEGRRRPTARARCSSTTSSATRATSCSTNSLQVVAIIPARGGSERVPRKNLLEVGGKPLVVHSIEHALAARLVNEVVVSTEDGEIADVAGAAGARVVMRPAELAGPEAASESALLHVLDELPGPDPDLVVFLQATSPVRRPSDVDAAIERLLGEGADSLLSVHPEKVHTWVRDEDGLRSVSYDWRHRQREQDMAPQLRENGSIYVFRPAVLRTEGNRLGGTITVYEMDWWSSFQLDEPEHAELLDWILTTRG